MINWYALKTNPRWEKKLAATLSAKGYEIYCPLNKSLRQWSDRKKMVEEPLFKSYLFVKTEDAHKYDVLQTKGIIGFVNYLGKPGIIREEEINTIKKFLSEFEEVQTREINYAVNNAVRINSGILMNYKGIIMEVLGKQAKVKLEGIGLSLTATLEQKHLDLLHESSEIKNGKK